MQITSLDYSSFVGRIAIGRVFRGNIHQGEEVVLMKKNGDLKKAKVKELYIFSGLGREKVEKVRSGDICAVVGLDDFEIGDTIADKDKPVALARISIDEPTMSMLFTINNSPFFGREGKLVTSQRIRERLLNETEKNLALRVQVTESEEKFNVYGRGILHLSILIETMRREGYELQVGRPKVIFKDVQGVIEEPYETLVIDVPEEYAGKAIELVTQRKGDLLIMEPKGDVQHLEFDITSRGLIGLRNMMMTATAGTAVMNHRFRAYAPAKSELPAKNKGALISMETGKALAFSLNRLQDRGRFFIEPGDEVYRGQVIGENTRQKDLDVNVTKGKKLTNMRAAGSDENVKLAPKIDFSLEEAMEYIRDDEYLEITPKSLRIRKINYKPSY